MIYIYKVKGKRGSTWYKNVQEIMRLSVNIFNPHLYKTVS